VAVSACLLEPAPALFSLWHCGCDTDVLGLRTVAAARGAACRRAPPPACRPRPHSVLRLGG